jgi:hypothetical protein
VHQLDAGNRNDRAPETFETEHGIDLNLMLR